METETYSLEGRVCVCAKLRETEREGKKFNIATSIFFSAFFREEISTL